MCMSNIIFVNIYLTNLALSAICQQTYHLCGNAQYRVLLHSTYFSRDSNFVNFANLGKSELLEYIGKVMIICENFLQVAQKFGVESWSVWGRGIKVGARFFTHGQ